MKTIIQKDTCTPMFTAAMHTHTHSGILLSHEKNDIMPLAATWIDLKNNILSEVSQRQVFYDIIYIWSLKHNTNNTNEPIYKIEADSQT